MTYLKKTWISKETTISPEEFNRIEGNIQHSLDFTNITNKPANIKGMPGKKGIDGEAGKPGPIGPRGPRSAGIARSGIFTDIKLTNQTIPADEALNEISYMIIPTKIPDFSNTEISQLPLNLFVEKLIQKVPNSKCVFKQQTSQHKKLPYIELTKTNEERIEIISSSEFNFNKSKDYIIHIGRIYDTELSTPDNTEGYNKECLWYTINVGVEYTDGTIIMGNNHLYDTSIYEVIGWRHQPLYLRTMCPVGKNDYEIKSVFITGVKPYKFNRETGVYTQYDPVVEGNSPTPILIHLPTTRIFEVDRVSH